MDYKKLLEKYNLLFRSNINDLWLTADGRVRIDGSLW